MIASEIELDKAYWLDWNAHVWGVSQGRVVRRVSSRFVAVEILQSGNPSMVGAEIVVSTKSVFTKFTTVQRRVRKILSEHLDKIAKIEKALPPRKQQCQDLLVSLDRMIL